MEVLIQNLANITLPSVIMWIIAAVALLNKLTSGK